MALGYDMTAAKQKTQFSRWKQGGGKKPTTLSGGMQLLWSLEILTVDHYVRE